MPPHNAEMLPCISPSRAEASRPLVWKQTGTGTVLATSSPFLLLEHFWSRDVSPESAETPGQCQPPSRSVLLVRRKRTHCRLGVLAVETVLTRACHPPVIRMGVESPAPDPPCPPLRLQPQPLCPPELYSVTPSELSPALHFSPNHNLFLLQTDSGFYLFIREREREQELEGGERKREKPTPLLSQEPYKAQTQDPRIMTWAKADP